MGVDLYNICKFGELCDALFCESNPVPVKRMLKLSGQFKNDYVRLPLVSLDELNSDRVKNTYEYTQSILNDNYN